MRKSILLFAVTITITLVAGVSIYSCQTDAQKTKKAQMKVNEAQYDLEVAQSELDVIQYKTNIEFLKFKKEADEKWIIVKADFPRKKANQLEDSQTEKNRKLAEKYNVEGSFPLVVILDKSGKILSKMGYKNVSPEEYIKMIHAVEK